MVTDVPNSELWSWFILHNATNNIKNFRILYISILRLQFCHSNITNGNQHSEAEWTWWHFPEITKYIMAVVYCWINDEWHPSLFNILFRHQYLCIKTTFQWLHCQCKKNKYWIHTRKTLSPVILVSQLHVCIPNLELCRRKCNTIIIKFFMKLIFRQSQE